jgi:hypothetical protein
LLDQVLAVGDLFTNFRMPVWNSPGTQIIASFVTVEDDPFSNHTNVLNSLVNRRLPMRPCAGGSNHADRFTGREKFCFV